MKRFLLVTCCLVACDRPGKPSVAPPAVAPVESARIDEDRAGLAGASADADGLVVRTRSGKLVRYDRNLRVLGEATSPSNVVAVALPFAALENGDIVRVDAALSLPPVGRASKTPRWIGTRGSDVIAFLEQDKSYTVETIRAGKTTGFEVARGSSPAHEIGHPSAFLLDGDSLWFGIDAGEWGGAIGKIDLKTHKLTSLTSDAVMGFAKHPDGRVLAHGGLIHMGMIEGTIGAIEGNKLVEVWKREGGFDTDPTNPRALPVVYIQPNGERMRILVWNELYDVSGDFKDWTKIVELPARTRAGRPDSVGDFPAVVAIVELGDALVFATTRDGLFVYKDGKLSHL